MKSEQFPGLPDITFADKDPDTITQELIKYYETSSGRTLSRADPVRLFIDAIILAIVHQRAVIDHAAKMNLLAYAEGEYLDHLGALLGVRRLEAAHSVCTMRFTLGHYYSYAVVIPEGTRISAGSYTFATTAELVISSGSLSGEVGARCVSAGASSNGLIPGQVRQLVDVLNFDVKAENITETNSGTDTETDEAYRERIQLAPESFSVAGPVKAYEYYARSANPDIIGVAVVGPPDTEPGNVNIYPLMTGGTLPSDEVLDEVLAACNADDVRPDTDFVHVLKPIVVNYILDVEFWVDAGKSSSAMLIRNKCVDAVEEWVMWQRSALGRDLNPSELVKRVMNAGAKRVEVISPAFRVMKSWEVAVCTSESVNYAGLEES